MKKETIFLLSLLTTSSAFAMGGEKIAQFELDAINKVHTEYNLESLTELLNHKPANDDTEWQKNVEETIKIIYLNQKLKNTNQNPTCASVE